MTKQDDLYQPGQQVAKLTNVGFAIEAINQVTDVHDLGAPHKIGRAHV